MSHLQQCIYAYLTEFSAWYQLSDHIVFITKFFFAQAISVILSQAVNFAALYSVSMKFDRVFALLFQTLLIYV